MYSQQVSQAAADIYIVFWLVSLLLVCLWCPIKHIISILGYHIYIYIYISTRKSNQQLLPFIARLAIAPTATRLIVSSLELFRRFSKRLKPPDSTIFS